MFNLLIPEEEFLDIIKNKKELNYLILKESLTIIISIIVNDESEYSVQFLKDILVIEGDDYISEFLNLAKFKTFEESIEFERQLLEII